MGDYSIHKKSTGGGSMKPLKNCSIGGKPYKLATKSVDRVKAVRTAEKQQHKEYFVIPFSGDNKKVFAVYVPDGQIKDTNLPNISGTELSEELMGFYSSNEMVEAFVDSPAFYDLQTTKTQQINNLKGD